MSVRRRQGPRSHAARREKEFCGNNPERRTFPRFRHCWVARAVSLQGEAAGGGSEKTGVTWKRERGLTGGEPTVEPAVPVSFYRRCGTDLKLYLLSGRPEIHPPCRVAARLREKNSSRCGKLLISCSKTAAPHLPDGQGQQDAVTRMVGGAAG
ncbi:hypothetical protein SKAU_G00368060 [Synaphobranchus kaupii]|uniref:Uncharacterized protein n=1 Tax=Synaphobranchus kaupii TaxID=118154 RepID=A0A9Q1EFH2_SYNKA|nr:hypothetical protein SKAU_G00368060 [Synaphobranchus kaupii]